MSIEPQGRGLGPAMLDAVLLDAAAQALASLARYWKEARPARAEELATLSAELALEAREKAGG